MPSAAVPIVIVALGVVALGASSSGKSRGPRRVTPGMTSKPSVPQWCKENWDSTQIMKALGVTNRVVAEMPEYDGDVDEARRQSYEATKLVLFELCPGIDLPPEFYHLAGYYDSKPKWWRDLWDRVSIWVWNAYAGPSA